MELRIDNLSKNFGDKAAVNGFSASYGCGLHALLGPNGSGKTTLMRILSNVMRQTSGTVFFNGEDIRFWGEAYREKLGYLPQNFGYYPNFTGLDFLTYMAVLKGLPKITATERSVELLNKVGLYEVRNKKIKTYSGGMVQRIGIAQSLLNDPEVLILDEPTSGLDPKERAKFRNIISDLAGSRIILLSTHIVSDVESAASDITVMKNGSAALFGNYSEVCESVRGKVWTLCVPSDESDKYSENFVVTALKHIGSEVELRIVSDSKPCADAESAEPTLEDMYLYFFREEAK